MTEILGCNDRCKSTAFAEHALSLRRSGYAVLPVALPDQDHDGKAPLIRNWSRWNRPPSLKAIEKWAAKFANANIAIQPGASRVMVADIDDADQVDEAIQALGETPLQVTTSRGGHLYYRQLDRPLPGTLQALGIKGEIKAGASIVVAPPSIHWSGAVYTLLGKHWIQPRDLPLPRLDWLERVSHHRPSSDRGHSRGLSLNDYLCSQVPYVDSLDELLDVARTRNDEGWPTCSKHESMCDQRVLSYARQVWRDHETDKLEAWIGRKTGRDDAELMKLVAVGKGLEGYLAHALLLRLRADHTQRCRRGETFALSAPAMARAGVMPGWGRRIYSGASRLLVKAGFIEIVGGSSGRSAARYRLL